MSATDLIFDPEGDVILVVKNTSARFAVWDERKDYDPPSSQTSSAPAQSVTPTANSCPTTSEEGPFPPTTPDTPSSQDQPEAADETSDNNGDIEMRVSSSQLALVSPYFRTMLRGGWKEGQIIRVDGSLRVYAEAWDWDALTIIMNIIHCHFRRVPREITLEMMAKILVMVDYFECDEIIEPFSRQWLDQLRPTLPNFSNLRDITFWIWISWELWLEDHFKTATYLAAKHSPGPLQTLGLPIPKEVIDEIDQKRQESIEELIGSLHNIVDTICEGRHSCTWECGSIMLGAIIREMKARHVFFPQPLAPFLGWSVTETVKSVGEFRSPKWCDMDHFSRGDCHTCETHHCNSWHQLHAIVEKDRVKGLEFDDFVRLRFKSCRRHM